MSMNAAVFLAYLAERLFIRYLIDALIGGGHCLNQSQYNTIIAGSN